MMLDDPTTTFVRERPRLLGIANRVLTCVSEAEDIVQDAWLRWERYDRQSVENPGAFLATTTVRLAINATQTAHARRETGVLSRLPEPIDADADPTVRAECDEEVTEAIVVLLSALTPAERAAYLLREAFDYPYGRIAAVLDTNEVNARQLVSRARRHLVDQPRAITDAPRLRPLLAAFLLAARHGDLTALEEVLRHDI